MNIFKIVELIVRKYKRGLSSDENITLQQWGERDARNRTLLDHFDNRNEVERNLVTFNSFDESDGWKSIKTRLYSKKIFKVQPWLRYAAVFLSIFFVGLLVLLMLPGKEAQLFAEQPLLPGEQNAILYVDNHKVVLCDTINKVVESKNVAIAQINQGKITCLEPGNKESVDLEIVVPVRSEYKFALSDGTNIWMNAGSRIKFGHPFKGANRDVYIEGEVFLDVAKDEEHPFVVHLQDQNTIRVLGTQFNVRAYPEDFQMNTVLVEGSILWNSGSNNEWIISPGQLLTRDNKDNTVHISNVKVASYVAWKEGQFHYENCPLGEILKDFSRWYGVEFIIKDQYLQNLRLSLKTKRYSNLQDILEILELTGKTRFSAEGSKITVRTN